MKQLTVLLLSLSIFALAVFPVFSSGKSEEPENDTGYSVFVSIPPQKYFVEKIGGEHVSVRTMVLPGRSPATYDPTPSQVIALGKSRVFFTVGVAFESAFLPGIRDKADSLLIVDTSEGIKKRMLEHHVHDGDDDDDGHDEDEGGTVDPHIWMSPVLVMTQAEIIYRTLVSLDPENESDYTAGYNELVSELEKLDSVLEQDLAPFKGKTLFVFHPSFGYFTDRYGMRQLAIETGGKEPSAAELEEVIEHARENDVKIVFVQPEFSRQSADAIARAVGGTVIVLNPLAEDYIDNMYTISENVRKAY